MISQQFPCFLIQMQHEPHIAKPKIAKNASSKLPQAFRMPASSSKRPQQSEDKQKHAHPHPQSEPKQEVKADRELQRKQRKSKNPFLPVKQFMKKAEQFAKEMREANLGFDLEKLSKYAIEGGRGRIKYENCITLSVVRRNTNSCLKKVLHVPTLSVHFLRESLISAHFDKAELNEWVGVINQQESATCIKILQIFWNMPQDYYSLLYEYSEGLLLDSLNDSLHTLPLPLLRDIANAHISSTFGIYNSQLILAEQAGSKSIKYLPLYEESDSLLESKRLKEIGAAQLGAEDASIQGRFVWKLGLVLLGGYLGSVVVGQDIEKVTVPLKKCCLLHEILALPSSLSSLFLSLNAAQEEALIDFLCKCLRSRKQADRQGRNELKSVRGHRFLQRKYSEVISLGEMIEVVDPSSDFKSKFEISKMNKILDSVSLILQNVTQVQASISADNKEVQWLAKQLGMGRQVEKVVSELKKVYKE